MPASSRGMARSLLGGGLCLDWRRAAVQEHVDGEGDGDGAEPSFCVRSAGRDEKPEL